MTRFGFILNSTRCLIALVTFCILISAPTTHALALTLLWSQHFAGSGHDEPHAVAFDASGNVLVVGTYGDYGGQGPFYICGFGWPHYGKKDLFLAKLDANGNYLWSRVFGDSEYDDSWSVGADAQQNVYVTGSFERSINLGGGTIWSPGAADGFVTKFNPQGIHLWTRHFESAYHIASFRADFDGQGNTLVTGVYRVSMTVIDTVLTTPTSAGNIFFTKLDSDGNHLWSRAIATVSASTRLGSVALDDASNILLAGSFPDSLQLGGSPLYCKGAYDIFAAKFNSVGDHVWSASFGDPDDDQGAGICADPSGNIFLAGGFQSNLNLGGPTHASLGNDDMFLAKYDSLGSFLWSHSFGSTGIDHATDVCADQLGNVFITGRAGSRIEFGGGPLGPYLADDIPLAAFDAAGNHLWSTKLGGSSDDYGKSVAIDGSGGVVVTGYFQGSGDFGNGTFTSSGYGDVVVTKFQPSQVTAAKQPIPVATATNLRATPNPFNPTTRITYVIDKPGAVYLSLHDVAGRQLHTLLHGEHRQPGEYTITYSRVMPSGVYFLRLTSGRAVSTLKVVSLK